MNEKTSPAQKSGRGGKARPGGTARWLVPVIGAGLAVAFGVLALIAHGSEQWTFLAMIVPVLIVVVGWRPRR